MLEGLIRLVAVMAGQSNLLARAWECSVCECNAPFRVSDRWLSPAGCIWWPVSGVSEGPLHYNIFSYCRYA